MGPVCPTVNHITPLPPTVNTKRCATPPIFPAFSLVGRLRKPVGMRVTRIGQLGLQHDLQHTPQRETPLPAKRVGERGETCWTDHRHNVSVTVPPLFGTLHRTGSRVDPARTVHHEEEPDMRASAVPVTSRWIVDGDGIPETGAPKHLEVA